MALLISGQFRVSIGKLLVAMVMTAYFSGTAQGQDHYCGVYSVYAVLDYYQRRVPFERLLEPEYVSGFEGSTAAAVVKALVDHGVAATDYAGLGVFDLRMSSGPVILHVRGNQGTRRYQHWVVYPGEQNGRAVILDPSSGRSVMAYSRLLALWDGVGIACASSSMEVVLWRTFGMGKRWGVLLMLGAMFVPVVQFVDRWPRKGGRSGTWMPLGIRVMAFLMACSATAIAIDLVDADGILRCTQARGCIASVHGASVFPEIDLQQAVLRHSQREGSTVWIDARFYRDYAAGHIAGALNLPIDATFAEEDAFIEQLMPASRIVVYCQSAGCGFADAVAERLRGHGFRDIQLFRQGFQEWALSGAAIEKVKQAPSNTAPPLSVQYGGNN